MRTIKEIRSTLLEGFMWAFFSFTCLGVLAYIPYDLLHTCTSTIDYVGIIALGTVIVAATIITTVFILHDTIKGYKRSMNRYREDEADYKQGASIN